MKKALLAALCFIVVSLLLVNGTFALPELDKVFADLSNVLGVQLGLPEAGGAGTAIHVELVSDNTPQNLYPGGKVSRAYKVQNLGEDDVYFRLVYAVQYDAESWQKLNVRFTAGQGFTEHDWKDISVDGTPYRMKVFTYNEALAANAASPEVSIAIAMDSTISSKQIARYRSDFLKTQVLAIDPAAFSEKGYTTAAQALDLALPLDTLNPF